MLRPAFLATFTLVSTLGGVGLCVAQAQAAPEKSAAPEVFRPTRRRAPPEPSKRRRPEQQPSGNTSSRPLAPKASKSAPPKSSRAPATTEGARAPQPPSVARPQTRRPLPTSTSLPARVGSTSRSETTTVPARQRNATRANAKSGNLSNTKPSNTKARNQRTIPKPKTTRAPSKTVTAAFPKTSVTSAASAEQSAGALSETAQTSPEELGETKSLPRPDFIRGELNAFSVVPTTRRSFAGVGVGLASIPNDTSTLLNTFYINVEPQVDIAPQSGSWRLGLGAPLRFELADTQGPLEGCLGDARTRMPQGQSAVEDATATCLADNADDITRNSGRLRQADWDEPSDYARLLRYLVIGRREEPFHLNVSRLFSQTVGHGTALRRYNANIDFNTARVGAVLEVDEDTLGGVAMANDLVNPDVMGGLMFIRPWRKDAESRFLRSLSFGVQAFFARNQPLTLTHEPGLFQPAFSEPIPAVDESLNHVPGAVRDLTILGGDIEFKVLREAHSDIKIYLDYQKMVDFGSGWTLGSLLRFTHGDNADHATRARVELTTFESNFLPSYFGTFHDIFSRQFIAAGYEGRNGLTYFPTKLGYLNAAQAGNRRIGVYAEVSHAIFNLLTIGISARAWRPLGSNTILNFSYMQDSPGCDSACTPNTPQPDQGMSTLRFHAELPLDRYLQAFASYELFSSTLEDDLGFLALDGDNELFFAGGRLMLLPIFFVQFEGRRYFFLQRVSDVNVEELTVRQDQNVHANWTFALTAYLGLEFN